MKGTLRKAVLYGVLGFEPNTQRTKEDRYKSRHHRYCLPLPTIILLGTSLTKTRELKQSRNFIYPLPNVYVTYNACPALARPPLAALHAGYETESI